MTTQRQRRFDDPGQPDAKILTQQGHVLRQQGDLSAAADTYFRALAAQPTYGLAHQALGFVLLRLQQYPQAALHFAKALALQPETARLHIGYGHALCGLDEYEPALEHYRRALLLKPDSPVAAFRLAHALRRLNRLEESLPYYQRAVQHHPAKPVIHYGYAAALIALGRIPEGFRQYEGRWRRVQPDVAAPVWQGEDLTGQSILLYREQGLGDTIQFVRYVPEVARRGGRVILQCQPPLARLLRTLDGVDQIVAKTAAAPPVTYHCSVMSLAYMTQSTLATLSAPVPYLIKRPKRRPSTPALSPPRTPLQGGSGVGGRQRDGQRSRALDWV